MLLSLGSTLLIVLIAASIALRKGLYRGTILFFSCLIGAVVAFSYWENVLVLLKWDFLQRFGEGITLMLLFLVVALVLDLVSERVLTGAMRLPRLVDRIGGGFVGFWTAMICVGVLCVAVQMLPWDRSVLGFERIYLDNKHQERTRSLLLHPDGFTVGLVGYLLDNAFDGGRSFRGVHPHLLEELARSNMRVQAESRRLVTHGLEGGTAFDVLTVMEMEEPLLGWARPKREKGEGSKGSSRSGGEDIAIEVSQASREPKEGYRYLVARSKLSSGAADPEDNYHRFTPQQVRMVGTVNGKPEECYLRGYREPSRMKSLGLVSTEQPILFMGKREQTFDLIFEVPQDFKPEFVEYKRLARAEVRGGDSIKPKSTEEILRGLRYVPPEERKALKLPDRILKQVDKRSGKGRPSARKSRPTKRPSARKEPSKKPAPKPKRPEKAPAKSDARAKEGRVGGRAAGDAHFGAELPFKLTKKALSDQHAETSGTALRSGHVYVEAANARGDPSQLCTTFAVPDNVRLLHVKCDAQFAKSLFGKAKSLAVKSTGQYKVFDSRKRAYLPIGEYRIATMRGKKMIELQYNAEGLAGRAIRQAQHIHENHLQAAGSSVTYLYHIPPGTQIVRFAAGPAALSKTDLNVTAPE